MKSPFHNTDLTGEEVWKQYIAKLTEHYQLNDMKKPLRIFRAKSQQREVIVTLIKGAKK